MENDFIILPAIDLRQGQVVRLVQGDPSQQTIFSQEPLTAARRWIDYGARWLHVVNLDGAFGEDDTANRKALESILTLAEQHNVRVQFGGGLRTLEAVRQAIEQGADRVILGTTAVENPDLLASALERWGAERIAAGVDARDGSVRVRGWATDTQFDPLTLAQHLQETGVRWLIYTDISRDGTSRGLNMDKAIQMAQGTFMKLVISGGVREIRDVLNARRAGMAGVIVGRALYMGDIDPEQLFGPLPAEGEA